jgi:hypothetical protein
VGDDPNGSLELIEMAFEDITPPGIGMYCIVKNTRKQESPVSLRTGSG